MRGNVQALGSKTLSGLLEEGGLLNSGGGGSQCISGHVQQSCHGWSVASSLTAFVSECARRTIHTRLLPVRKASAQNAFTSCQAASSNVHVFIAWKENETLIIHLKQTNIPASAVCVFVPKYVHTNE